jgi:hypothetical protein
MIGGAWVTHLPRCTRKYRESLPIPFPIGLHDHEIAASHDRSKGGREGRHPQADVMRVIDRRSAHFTSRGTQSAAEASERCSKDGEIDRDSRRDGRREPGHHTFPFAVAAAHKEAEHGGERNARARRREGCGKSLADRSRKFSLFEYGQKETSRRLIQVTFLSKIDD